MLEVYFKYSHVDCYVGRIAGVKAVGDDVSSLQNLSFVENLAENCVVDVEKMMKMHQLKLLILPVKKCQLDKYAWALQQLILTPFCSLCLSKHSAPSIFIV